MLGRVLVRRLLLHDVAHVLVGLCARLVVQQHLLKETVYKEIIATSSLNRKFLTVFI